MGDALEQEKNLGASQQLKQCKAPEGCSAASGPPECGFELKKVRYSDFLTTIRLIY
jgi:hypothetical protein